MRAIAPSFVVCTLLLLSLSINSGDILGEQVQGEDPYLQKAFAQFSFVPLTSPSQEQEATLKEIIRGIRQAAQKKQPDRLHHIDEATIGTVGITAFPALLPLLKDPDPWVRGMTVFALFALDRRRSVPFLVGLLTDTGLFQWMDDVRDTTVGSAAESCLSGVVYQSITLRVLIDEIDQPMAHIKAMQRWYDYHLPYYTWMENPRYGVYWANELALYTGMPADEIANFRTQDPDRFKKLLVILPDVGRMRSSDQAVWKIGEPAILGITFMNIGSETVQIRYDQRDGRIHQFRLLGPDGREIPMNRSALRPLPDDTPLFQGIYGGHENGGYAIGWLGDFALNLHEMYDLSKPGRYRFYYTYSPPPQVERRAEEWEKETKLRFWDGRTYVDYFEFLLR